MSKNAVMVVSGVAVVLAALTGCSGSSGNGDLTSVGQGQGTSGGLGGGLGSGGLGGGLGGGGTSTKGDAGTGGTTKGGTSSSSSSGGSNASCKANTGEPACDSCLEQSCCAETSACANDAPCASLWSCLLACGGDNKPCMQQCVDDEPNGVPTLKPWLACANTKCSAQCQ